MSFDDYQLMVIDEVSEDDTLHILNILAETNPRLKVTCLSQETRFLEKQSINIGLKGASSPWIVQITSNLDHILVGITDLLYYVINYC